MATTGNERVEETNKVNLMEVVEDEAVNDGENIASKETTSLTSSSASTILGATADVSQADQSNTSSSSSVSNVIGARTEEYGEVEGHIGGGQSGEGGNNSSKNSSGFGSNWHALGTSRKPK
jgi:hypothetical protein